MIRLDKRHNSILPTYQIDIEIVLNKVNIMDIEIAMLTDKNTPETAKALGEGVMNDCYVSS